MVKFLTFSGDDSRLMALTTNNRLVSFDSENPSFLRTNVAIGGLLSYRTLETLDFNPATGALTVAARRHREGDQVGAALQGPRLRRRHG